MKITLHQVTIGELVDGYADRSESEEGITGLGGRLNIRPKYQREFVYGMKERNAVMDTVWRGFPLNVMYWVRTTPEVEGSPLDGKFELLDGQKSSEGAASRRAIRQNMVRKVLGHGSQVPRIDRRPLRRESAKL